MVDRRDVGSWLAGPEAVTGVTGYPGERLERPETGPGSLARPGRRFASVLIDWIICLVIARGFFGTQTLEHPAGSLIPVAVLLVENILLVGTAGFTVGQRVLGVHVERVVGGGPIGLLRGVVRAVLLVLVIPPLTMGWDVDRRGLHDLISGSVVARN
ncbi:RDD family protein [Kineosporia sp. J2-2]|uniref:RDD family protein n=1 Tax=Kineosporia corallincola TaxID=2835133 RepID=A0ABS5TIZ4_9ACTN|nr:RDD family protein [Kineosporia corallincola]MBT0770980.1 RDD family protein [Kineosporia corallincola]